MAASSVVDDSDSACARLLRLVQQGRARADGAISQRDAWPDMLQVSVPPPVGTFEAIAAFCRLVHDAQEEIKALNLEDPKLYLEPYEEVEALLARIHIGNNIGDIFGKGTLHDGTIRGLRYGAAEVAKSSTRRFSRDQLSELREQIGDVEKAIGSDCPPDLRPVLEKCLKLLRVSLNHYEVFGADGIEEAVQRAFGILFTNVHLVSVNKKSLALIKFKELLATFNVAVSTVRNVQTVLKTGAAITALLIPPPTSEMPHAMSTPPSLTEPAATTTRGEPVSI